MGAFFRIRPGAGIRMLLPRHSSFETASSRRRNADPEGHQRLRGLIPVRPPATDPVSSALPASCNEVQTGLSISSGKRAGRTPPVKGRRFATRFSNTAMRWPLNWPAPLVGMRFDSFREWCPSSLPSGSRRGRNSDRGTTVSSGSRRS